MLDDYFDNFKKVLQIKRLKRILWNDWPWLPAAVSAVAIGSGLIVIQHKLFPDLINQVSVSSELVIPFLIVVAGYFCVSSILLFSQLRTERRIREAAQSFRYDRRGTLYNAEEPNIAIRVKTFRLILEEIGKVLDAGILEGLLARAGEIAPVEFAENIEKIYERDIRQQIGKKSWKELNFQEKLDEWTDYDCNTGWGVVAARAEGSRVEVQITHFRGLFEGTGGHLFACFLSGYCRLLISHIVKGHHSGQYHDFSEAILAQPVKTTDMSAQLIYNLR